MLKSELRKLRTLNATKEMMEKSNADGPFKNPRTDFRWPKEYKRKYGYFLRCQELDKYIKIAVFLPQNMKKGDNKPSYEIFLNVEGGQYITRVLKDGKEEKWSNAKIDNINGGSYYSDLYYCQHHAWINPEGYKKLKDRLGTKKGGYEGILEWQEKILKEKIEEKERRETAPWDKDMEMTPELPKSFDKWVKKEAITTNFIFYTYKKSGVKTGYCSYCEKEVPVKKPKHNETGRCSCCGRKITYKASGKIKTLCTNDESCQIIQKIPDGVMVRTFRVRKYYRDSKYEDPHYTIHEHRRNIIQENKIKTYDWELYKNKYHRWIRENYHQYYNPTGLVYKRNLSALEKTVLMKSSLPTMIRMNKNVNVEKFLRVEKGNPVIEKLVKTGMFTMALDFYNADNCDNKLIAEKETELTKLLKIDKSRLIRLRNMDASIQHLKWMQAEKKANTIWPDEMIDFFSQNSVTIGDLKFIKNQMSYLKIKNYIKKQQEMSGEKVGAVITTWRDYLNMAKNAKMQINLEQIFKPKNLKEAHTEMIVILQSEEIDKQVKKRQKQFPNVNKVLKTLEKYRWFDEKYAIIAPKDIHDIIKEGIALQHCIHTCDYYFDRINRRESYILFLRKTDAPATPYYTLEVEPSGNIRQKRTTGDNQNKDFDEALGFLKKWQKQLSKKLDAEDMELGKKSNELRKMEYDKLRKDRAKIWHGKLAGQLLADVLEGDFMEVDRRCS